MSLGARDNACMSGALRSVSRSNASRGILRAAEISKAAACRSGDFYSCNVGAVDVGMGICDFQATGLSRVVQGGGTSPRPLCRLLTYG